jgi:hypothetical protein
MYLVACGAGPQLGRIGAPISLPNGEPRSTCENEGWYELAPTRIETHTVRGGGNVQTHYFQLHEGVGVYRPHEEDPQDLENVWPSLRQPGLQQAHQARIQPVDDASTAATWWFVAGLIGLGGGLGAAPPLHQE